MLQFKLIRYYLLTGCLFLVSLSHSKDIWINYNRSFNVKAPCILTLPSHYIKHVVVLIIMGYFISFIIVTFLSCRSSEELKVAYMVYLVYIHNSPVKWIRLRESGYPKVSHWQYFEPWYPGPSAILWLLHSLLILWNFWGKKSVAVVDQVELNGSYSSTSNSMIS